MRKGKGAYFMNLSAALNTHGSFSGLSKMFPNSSSSALYSFKNRPARMRARQTSLLVPNLFMTRVMA